MANIFNSVKLTKPKSNNFDLSHSRKFSFKFGDLTPCYLQEVIPGDNINLKSEQLIRVTPLVSPAMQEMDVYTHFFFVPNRILWANWENFITGGEDGLSNPQFPYIQIPDTTGFKVGSIPDYFGLPTGQGFGEKVSALPFWAYAKIYDEYYRDQNLQTPIWELASDGDNSASINSRGLDDVPFKRAWKHDYFTSALPFPQKGPEATIPLGTTADVDFAYLEADRLWNHITGTYETTGADIKFANPVGPPTFSELETVPNGNPASIDNSRNLSVDLSTASASTINDLRTAFRLQEWLERNARAGSRYVEHILAHFGVKSSDKRLQRPEYLGGGKSPIIVSEVLQTSESASTPLAEMAGRGMNVGQNHSFSVSIEEHGYIIGIISALPKASYLQGIEKHFFKFDKFDYYYPTFAHLGEQAIANKEIYAQDSNPTANDDVFGYTPRYAEYKFMRDSIHGQMRTSLNYWHMARIFASPPVLNEEFIQCEPEERIFAVVDPNEDKLICHMYHNVRARRPMPVFGTPQF